MANIYGYDEWGNSLDKPVKNILEAHGNCVHFPDLAELRSGNLGGGEDLSTIPTEFVFCTTGTTVGSVSALLKLGFEEVGAMKNWHWIHHNEWTKPIRLFWKRIHSVKEAKPYNKLNPQHFSAAHENICDYHRSQVPLLQRNGCGMKLGEKPTRHSFYRYFGLLRLPIKPSKRQLRWLKYANYRLIATGSMASYWNNGWLSGDDWSVKKEKAFWVKRGICFKEALDFTYTNLTKKEREQYTPGLRVRLTEHIQEGGDPHNMFLDPTICATPYTHAHLKYGSGGTYKLTAPESYDLKAIELTGDKYNKFVSNKHFFDVGDKCYKCGTVKDTPTVKAAKKAPPAKGHRKAVNE